MQTFDVIEGIKNDLESACPGTVSCADILAVAARDAIVALGGPSWEQPLGRRDSLTAHFDRTADLPSPFAANVSHLTKFFQVKGFTVQEMVVMSAHTFGKARRKLFRERLYNETDINPGFAASLRTTCPVTGGDDNLSSFDAATPALFDAAYYKDLAMGKGLLHSDQMLLSINEGAAVNKYADDEAAFGLDFAAAMLKMAHLSPLTGSQGQIRHRCNLVNE